MDITKFYPSIDHNILKSIISRKIKDTKVLEILYEIIDSVNGINGIYGKGVPIGNYLSQYFANLYLTGFDHWCKEELKCRYYYRYADDIVILGESKAHLRNVLVAIKLYLKHVLKIEEGYNLKEGGSRGELSTKSLAKMSESLKRGYSEFPERREKIRNKALGRKMPKDTRCKISLNHSKSNLLKINDEVGSIRYWALKIGKAHSVLSYRLKVHGIDNLRKYIEQRIKLV